MSTLHIYPLILSPLDALLCPTQIKLCLLLISTEVAPHRPANEHRDGLQTKADRNPSLMFLLVVLFSICRGIFF